MPPDTANAAIKMFGFDVIVTPHDHWIEVDLIGDLDLYNAPQLRARVGGLIPTRKQVVLNMADMSFIDSTGISALISLRNKARRYGGDITLASVPAHTRKVLDIIGLGRAFTFA